jgi:hypothetical protein
MHVRFLLTTLLVMLASVCGCIPFPHTSERSPTIQGRVLNSATGQPIGGANVYLADLNAMSAKTDAKGFFRLRGTSNFHMGVIASPCGGDFPAGSYCSTFVVSCDGFLSQRIDAYKYAMLETTNKISGLLLRDIFLDPSADGL